ncbi:MAG: hypothetical protein Q7Q71_00635 [Verrucomicrobiota bacterium JB023]|nr:hypothetical protein [Verrucomicrobiota bacterium JB023]
MSLRGFHLVFITFATLLSLFMAVWCFVFAPANSGIGVDIMGWLSAVSAVILPIYGFRFYQKAKNIIL